ncbi:hypothetical protein BO70DRAFT_432632 [Aspergillus heteromorphus CBS 117.55]|uniref:t-SNARE coiled-coil homology domain-containing protein n=1 Tax=Aspergillus heteromorphus CBS 117.55 TaxID=1448321 RepID=A0A317V6Q5_9EURO|nr:uncharacterized protein BO70DRAFT_432632 [Aspergillus heteromorphus CBS 117.55]PWY69139.1 hypothetical protein BO70DRAFT_432632 [Aspergillus heteromorphus CBS 117.55]
MSHLDGNAWKAKKEQLRLSGESGDGDQDSPGVKATPPGLSKLDYDAELALPMPKPRHDRPDNHKFDLPASGSSKGGIFGWGVNKNRSFTEPGAGTAPDKKTDKKSAFQAIRSKLSMKDLAKEFRKEIPPVSTMPKISSLALGIRDSGSSSDSYGRVRLPGATSSNFEVERLYTPRPKVTEVLQAQQPLSAPLFPTAGFPGPDEFSPKGVVVTSPTSVGSSGEKGVGIVVGGGNGHNSQGPEKFKHALISDHGNRVGEGPTSHHLEAVLLDGSSPAARTGEFKNSGQPEFVTTPRQRARSMKAEKGAGSSEAAAAMAASESFPLRNSEIARSYSPSVYDTLLSEKRTSDLPLRAGGNDSSIEEVSVCAPVRYSDATSEGFPDYRLSLITTTSSYMPSGQAQQQGGEASAFAGAPAGEGALDVTRHGGYAPTPPVPGYQNTNSLEEQLALHVKTIHHHVDDTANRLVKAVQDSNNWNMDQILKQVDALSEVAQLLGERAAAQSKIVQDTRQSTSDVQSQLQTIYQELRRMQSRMATQLREEIGKVRYDVHELQARVGPRNPAAEAVLAAGLQGPPLPLKKAQGEMGGGGGGEVRKSTKRDKEDGGKQQQNPSLDDSDIPTPKASRFNLRTDAIPPLVPGNGQVRPLAPSHGKGKAKDEKEPKTPVKKGFFHMRRQRDGDSHTGHSSSRPSHAHAHAHETQTRPVEPKPPVTPPSQTGPGINPQTVAQTSPSLIHPAMRTPQQQKVMDERKREEEHQRKVLLEHDIKRERLQQQTLQQQLRQRQLEQEEAQRKEALFQEQFFLKQLQQPHLQSHIQQAPPQPSRPAPQPLQQLPQQQAPQPAPRTKHPQYSDFPVPPLGLQASKHQHAATSASNLPVPASQSQSTGSKATRNMAASTSHSNVRPQTPRAHAGFDNPYPHFSKPGTSKDIKIDNDNDNDNDNNPFYPGPTIGCLQNTSPTTYSSPVPPVPIEYVNRHRDAYERGLENFKKDREDTLL